MTEKYILGVDPGRSKTGLGLLKKDGTIIKHCVVLMDDFLQGLQSFVADFPLSAIVLGDGTTSDSMEKTLKQVFPELSIHVVAEGHSTQEARQLYWQLYPPKGLKRLIPLGLQVPPINLDGLAALVLARRYLKNNR